MMSSGDLLQTILIYEIARELLIESYPDISTEMVDMICEKCVDNPFDAPILYQLLQLTQKEQ